MDQTQAPTTTPTEIETRVRAIRSRVPGQMLRERLEMARLLYGPLFTLAEIRQKVGQTLPRRAGYARGAALEPIEEYQERQVDPWIVAEVMGADRCAVIAQCPSSIGFAVISV